MGHLPLLLWLTALVAVGSTADQDPPPDTLASKWRPGEVLGSTDHAQIELALSDVDDVASIFETRTASIGVASLNGKLKNPRFKLKDGDVQSTLPPDINTGQTGLILFTKHLIGIKGVYGVVTYEIEGTDFVLAIMFSVPFNSISYDYLYNVKIYSNTVPVDSDLVKQMYYYAGAWKAQGYEERSEYGINLRGTMTENPHSHIIVWVDTSEMDIALGPSRYAECAYRVSSLGDRCWRECTPTGWCWTNVKCKNSNDCNGKMFCDLSCNSVYASKKEK